MGTSSSLPCYKKALPPAIAAQELLLEKYKEQFKLLRGSGKAIIEDGMKLCQKVLKLLEVLLMIVNDPDHIVHLLEREGLVLPALKAISAFSDVSKRIGYISGCIDDYVTNTDLCVHSLFMHLLHGSIMDAPSKKFLEGLATFVRKRGDEKDITGVEELCAMPFCSRDASELFVKRHWTVLRIKLLESYGGSDEDEPAAHLDELESLRNKLAGSDYQIRCIV